MAPEAVSVPPENSFGFETTAEEVLAGVDLTGKRAIVTGGGSGIGRETARVLAAAGAEVTIGDRDLPAAESAASGMAASGRGSAHAIHLDLVDRHSIDTFVAAWDGPLDILVNSAGVMAFERLTLTAEGREMHFAVNHLGHFALALGLHPALAAAGEARIVALSSSAHRRSPVVFDDIDFERREYEPFLGYGQSKTATVLFAVEAARRWAGDGIVANAVMPGGAATNLQQHVPDYLERAQDAWSGTMRLKTVEQAAATPAFLAASPLVRGVTGRYFENCQEGTLQPGPAPAVPLDGVAPYALDPGNARRLWEVSLDLLGAADNNPPLPRREI